MGSVNAKGEDTLWRINKVIGRREGGGGEGRGGEGEAKIRDTLGISGGRKGMKRKIL